MPPRLFLITAAITLGLNLLWPWRLGWGTGPVWLGLLLLGGSIWLMLAAHQQFVRAETAVSPRKQASLIVQTGPYRYSRNPMYLAFVGLQAGIALALSSVWGLLLLTPLGFILHVGVILPEERYLQQQFGARYTAYRKMVRRWL